MPAYIHAGEMIIPASAAAYVRATGLLPGTASAADWTVPGPANMNFALPANLNIPAYGLPAGFAQMPDLARSQAAATGALPTPAPASVTAPRPSRPVGGGGATNITIQVLDAASVANLMQRQGVGNALIKSLNRQTQRGARLAER